MWFNSDHHHEDVAIHTHQDGSEYHHDNSNKDDDNSCCNQEISKITKADKLAPQASKPFLTTVFISLVVTVQETKLLTKNTLNKLVLNSHHPPPFADIRVAIRSFQI